MDVQISHVGTTKKTITEYSFTIVTKPGCYINIPALGSRLELDCVVKFIDGKFQGYTCGKEHDSDDYPDVIKLLQVNKPLVYLEVLSIIKQRVDELIVHELSKEIT